MLPTTSAALRLRQWNTMQHPVQTATFWTGSTASRTTTGPTSSFRTELISVLLEMSWWHEDENESWLNCQMQNPIHHSHLCYIQGCWLMMRERNSKKIEETPPPPHKKKQVLPDFHKVKILWEKNTCYGPTSFWRSRNFLASSSYFACILNLACSMDSSLSFIAPASGDVR